MDDTDLHHLRRAVALAAEALAAGDEPFGSVLVDGRGVVRCEDRNRVGGGDETRHPELALAQWAAGHLTPAERVAATVYTSGEHCPMCAAAHAWVGLGRIVYAVSAAQLTAWRTELGAPASAVRPLPVQDVAPGVVVEGPAPELADAVRELHRRHATRPVFTRLHHVQIAMPAGAEQRAREFFVGVLGMTEVDKPPLLAKRGGAWFRAGGVELHLGAEEGFTPDRKGHPGILVDDLDDVAARLAGGGYPVRWDDEFPGYRRVYSRDPFENRLEFLEEA